MTAEKKTEQKQKHTKTIAKLQQLGYNLQTVKIKQSNSEKLIHQVYRPKTNITARL